MAEAEGLLKLLWSQHRGQAFQQPGARTYWALVPGTRLMAEFVLEKEGPYMRVRCGELELDRWVQ